MPSKHRALLTVRKPAAESLLRCFDQLHLSFARAVKDHHFSFRIAEDEDVAIAKMGLFDCFFERHRPHRNGVPGVHEVYFRGLSNRWKFVDRH